ncbi:MAG: flagellar basal body-associated FliL family protein [Lachnospiraceae bacterium]|nr:flagellar basal body-associated FliL family protein [Lachnospiraceae bacterium]
MKKNLVTVITLALVLVNLVLTVVLTISIVPETKKANELIAKVCGAIDLDLESGSASSAENIPIENLEVYNIEDKMTINLKKGEDGKDHFAIVTVALSINKKHEDYKKLQPQLSEKQNLIKAEINNVVSKYTIEEVKNNQSAVQEELLKNLQKMFASDFIVAVGFPDAQYQ